MDGPTLRTRYLPFRRHQRRNDEHGGAVVEAVLVTPLFLLLIFGIIELGPVFLNWNGIHTATREGARVGSVAGATPDADFQILEDIRSRLRGSVGRLNYVIVFKGITTTDDPPSDCVAAAQASTRGVPDKCNVYFPSDFTRPASEFGNGTAAAADVNWPAQDRIDYTSGPPDLVGVHISSQHKTLTGVIPTATLQYTTVFAIESTTGEGE